MKYILAFLFAFLLFPFLIFGQSGEDSLKEFMFPQVNWTIRFPTDAGLLDAAQFDTLSRNPNSLIQGNYNLEAELKKIKLLFLIRQGQYNLFGSTINLHDTTGQLSEQAYYDVIKKGLIKLITDQEPNVKIADTVFSKEEIGGSHFEKFYLKTFYPKQNTSLVTILYYRKYNEYDFSINISYMDESMGNRFMKILKDSRFK